MWTKLLLRYSRQNCFKLSFSECCIYYTGQFISSSGNSDFCSTVAGMVTPKRSMSTEGESLQVSVLPYRQFLPHALQVCGRNLVTGLTFAASPRVDISSTCKVRQKLGVSLPLLTCSPSAWPSWLLYRRGRKSRRDIRITLYKVQVYLRGL